jgi:hypothetical protein
METGEDDWALRAAAEPSGTKLVVLGGRQNQPSRVGCLCIVDVASWADEGKFELDGLD